MYYLKTDLVPVGRKVRSLSLPKKSKGNLCLWS